MNEKNGAEAFEIRELSLEDIEATSGAGVISWIRRLFGGDDPRPPRGPHNNDGK
jgi:hypothetical protein